MKAEPVGVEANGRVEVVDEITGDRTHGSRIASPGMPRPGFLPPSQALTVAPTSENTPSSWIRPAALRPCTYASSRACSREWSVEGVVGSQPWSEVMISRSPSR